jgi:hypothetical protein
MKRIVCLAFFFAAIAGSASSAETCNTTFIYKTRSPECIDAVVRSIDAAPRANQAETNPAVHSNQAIVGLLAGLLTDPADRTRILNQERTSFQKGLYIEGLYRANLLAEAKRYADESRLSEVFQRYKDQNLPPIADVKPGFAPADNDILIGAYMSSGDTRYIKRIIEAYRDADDATVQIALRMAFMNSKFGGGLAPPEREKTMAMTICERYECRTNPQKFMRLAALSSAFWALQSLSQQDEGIKQTLAGFFEQNPHLKKLLEAESAAFSNYMTLLIAYAAIKDNPVINSSLLTYEKLGSGEAAIKVITGHP